MDSETIITKASNGFEVRKFDVKEGLVEAVVTSFKNYDNVNDVIEPKALDAYIQKEFNGALPMLFQHDKNLIIGEWNELAVKGDLVIGKGMIYPEVSKGADTIALISRGQIGATSIGFKASDYERNDEGGINFKEISLVEISMVARPANPKAQLLSAKNDDGTIDVKSLEIALRDAGLSRKEAKTLIANGVSELRDAVKADLEREEYLRKLKSELGGLLNV